MKTQVSQYIITARQLGLRNVLTVLTYRLATKSRLLEWVIPIGAAYKGDVFPNVSKHVPVDHSLFDKQPLLAEADNLVDQHQMTYFGRHVVTVDSPPLWFCNPFNGQCMQDAGRHFSRIGDFNSGVGDIKTIWEISRFAWTPLLAQAFRLTGNPEYVKTINVWTQDWIQHNPYGVGPNWKCGQEATIRMLNMLLAAHILGQDTNPSDVLLRFVAEHCRRIRPTYPYAKAQDNNHGTSEAAGLFVGGAWLMQHAGHDAPLQSRLKKWREYGRRNLEERIWKLVEDDGSFSQKSLNYHRVLVDTLSLAEFWRRKCAQPPFSDSLYKKSRTAVEWLSDMVDEETGDGPNLGSNDGARLMALSSTPYRDYRASVQLGRVLFGNGAASPAGPWNEPLVWLKLQNEMTSQTNIRKKSKRYDGGGYVIIRGDQKDQARTWGMIRYPRFKTRPAHADIFHFDLWCRGENILRDDGTYSYAAPESLQSYFTGTASHNTIQFDGCDQMPRLGRFLFGHWIKPSFTGDIDVIRGAQTWSGAYKNNNGCFHKRTVSLNKNVWEIDDEISGYKKSAVLRWRLQPADWSIEGNVCRCRDVDIQIHANIPWRRFELVEGYESRHYFEISKIPVLEVEIPPGQATLKTRLSLLDQKQQR